MRYVLPIIAALAAGAPFTASRAVADTVWQWTDARGQAHFSDTAPATPAVKMQITRFGEPEAPLPGGLRPGERSRLRSMEQRQRQREKRLRAARRRNDRAVAEQRSHCQAIRDRLHRSHDREQRKQHAGYLRKNCW